MRSCLKPRLVYNLWSSCLSILSVGIYVCVVTLGLKCPPFFEVALMWPRLALSTLGVFTMWADLEFLIFLCMRIVGYKTASEKQLCKPQKTVTAFPRFLQNQSTSRKQILCFNVYPGVTLLDPHNRNCVWFLPSMGMQHPLLASADSKNAYMVHIHAAKHSYI